MIDDAPNAVPVVRAICGPTAAGKSTLAMQLAERLGLAIVSADSRQVYRGFDVGTAKPTADDRARVPHFGIDVVDATERYSAARWAESFDGWVREASALGRDVVVVGGTGLYLRALAEPLFHEPPLDPDRRARLAEQLEAMPNETLRRWVEALDPARAALGRTQLLRAAEIALLTGRRVSDLHAEAARAPRHVVRFLVIDPGRDVLRERITERTDAMIAAGWVDEVRALVAAIPAHAPAWNSTGYDMLRRHIRGELSLDEAREHVIVDTRQFAKRQRTWFRHQLGAAERDGFVTRIDPLAPNAYDMVESWWHEAKTTTA